MGSQVYRCLRKIGSKVTQPEGGSLPVELEFRNYLSVVTLPGYDSEVPAALMDHLESHKNLFDELVLEVLPEESILLNSLVPQLSEAGWSSSIRLHLPAH